MTGEQIFEIKNADRREVADLEEWKKLTTQESAEGDTEGSERFASRLVPICIGDWEVGRLDMTTKPTLNS